MMGKTFATTTGEALSGVWDSALTVTGDKAFDVVVLVGQDIGTRLTVGGEAGGGGSFCGVCD